MTTAINGKRQIRAGTVDVARLETDFLKGQDWDINGGSADPGTITGVPDPVNDLDVANKHFVQAYVDSAVSGGGTIGLGTAEDGSYADGLFPDLTPTTTIGTAVDRFNEILKSLSPSPAPALTATSSATSGASGKLSFDATEVIPGVTPVPGMNINTTFAVSGTVRGIINASTAVTGTLASNVTPGYTNGRPYPNLAFADGTSGQLHLELNGTVVKSVDLTTFASGAALNGQGSGFNLSAASPVQFDNGNPLQLFQYRTGTFTVAAASMVPGHNSVRVRHEYAAGQFRDTNTITWVVDNDVTATTFTGSSLTALNLTGSRYISGVRYHTGGSAAYSIAIHNAYRNTYSNSASALTFNGTNCSASAMALGNMASYTDDVIISNKVVTINGTRVINGSISISCTVARTVQGPATSGINSLSGLLIEATTDTDTELVEAFTGEGWRLHGGLVLTDTVYGQAAGSSNYTWDSTQNLISGSATHNTGLLISGGALTYPKNTSHISITNGNFSACANGYAGNADYTLAAGNRTYMRWFYAATSRSNFRLAVTATGTTFVPVSTGPSGNNVTMEILAPNTTKKANGTVEWKDAVVAYTNDQAIGCYASTFGNAIPTNWGMTLGTKNTSTSGKVIAIRITAAPAWTGKITGITCTWL